MGVLRMGLLEHMVKKLTLFARRIKENAENENKTFIGQAS